MKLDELLQKCRVQAQVKGFSQAYLSQKLGVSRSALGHWMTGKRLPSLENLFALVNVLELELTLQPPPTKESHNKSPTNPSRVNKKASIFAKRTNLNIFANNGGVS